MEDREKKLVERVLSHNSLKEAKFKKDKINITGQRGKLKKKYGGNDPNRKKKYMKKINKNFTVKFIRGRGGEDGGRGR